VNVWSEADQPSGSKSEGTSIRGNRQPSINETYADEVEGPPGRTDRRKEWRRKSRDEEQRSKIDETHWISVEFDRWRYDEGNIRIRRLHGSVSGVEYGAGPLTASH
jgi:hypothetical protein